jgi:hypothetical protein
MAGSEPITCSVLWKKMWNTGERLQSGWRKFGALDQRALRLSSIHLIPKD